MSDSNALYGPLEAQVLILYNLINLYFHIFIIYLPFSLLFIYHQILCEYARNHKTSSWPSHQKFIKIFILLNENQTKNYQQIIGKYFDFLFSPPLDVKILPVFDDVNCHHCCYRTHTKNIA